MTPRVQPPRSTLRSLVSAFLLLFVALPLLLLAAAWQRIVRTFTTPASEAPRMPTDPFHDCPPQPVVFECRHEECGLRHEREVHQFATVEDTVAYYCQQGHQAIARFPAADDAEWPPDEACRED